MGKRVLITDDAMFMRVTLKNILTKNGYEIVGEAERKEINYEIQDEEAGTQTVRVWGNTAVVTAKLHIKGAQAERRFDRKLWFSDTYVCSDGRWKYAFGQASLPLPSSQ